VKTRSAAICGADHRRPAALQRRAQVFVCGAGGNRTPVPQPVYVLATTIPGIDSDAETPTGRLPDRARPRSVFPESQQSFPLAMVFPIVIPHFCCQAVVEWPRATFLLTMTLRSSEMNQAARANCSSAILLVSPFNESEKLGSQTRTALLTSNPVSPLFVPLSWRCSYVGTSLSVGRDGTAATASTRAAIAGTVEFSCRTSPRD